MSGPRPRDPSAPTGDDDHFFPTGDGQYHLDIAGLPIRFEIDRLRRESQALWGELRVWCALSGAQTVDGYLSVADFNLSSAQSRTSRAKLLLDRSTAELPWATYIEKLCVRTITAERSGAPAVLLETFEPASGPEATHDVDGWPLLRDHPVIGFGDGGSAKSYLALYAAGLLAQRGTTVIYADWELDGAAHRDRLTRLFGGLLPKVHYMRCEKPLVQEADRIYRETRRVLADYWIADSIAFAVPGKPEDAEHAMAYFRVTRQIGLGSLHLAHINRSETAEQKPFGSSFWHNSARATWFLKQASVGPNGDRVTVGIFNRKSNLTRQHPAIGFELSFGPIRTIVARVNLADVADLAVKLPLWQRIMHALKHGPPLTVDELAEELEADKDTVRKAVTRAKKLFVLLPGPEKRYAVLDRAIGDA